MARLTDLQQEAEFRRCAKDELYFLRTYWHIRHPERGRILFDLRPAQVETLERWNNERYTIALKARQIGFSTLAAAHAVWLAFFHPDRFIIMLSKAEREAVKLLQKAKYGYKYLPQWMLDRGPRPIDDNQTKMSWDNESGIESLPSASDPARGEAVYLVIVDEWAFLPNPDEAWASIEPITDVGGRVIGVSTANGSGNFFHNTYVGAKTGSNLFGAIFYPWSAGDRDDAWYAAKARSMAHTPWILHQEYPRDDVECFIKSGMSVFDIEQLDAMPTKQPEFRGYLLAVPGAGKAARPVEDEMGPLQVWEKPKRDGRRYVIGADCAEGLEHGDYSVCHVIDTKTGMVVAKWRGHVEIDLFGSQVLWHLGWWYGGALIGVEVNNMGIAAALALQQRGYPNLYYRTSYDERSQKQSRKLGWRTQVNTKPLMIAELAKALRLDEEFDDEGEAFMGDGEITLLDSETIAELKTFVREPDGKKMHGSPFDDQTISLAITNMMRRHAFTAEWEEETTDPWSIKGWEQFAEEHEVDDDDEWLIGAGNGRR